MWRIANLLTLGTLARMKEAEVEFAEGQRMSPVERDIFPPRQQQARER